MNSAPNILTKSTETQQYHLMDLNTFIFNESKTIIIDGEITPNVAEAINQMLLSLHRLEPSKVVIILSNASCTEYRLVFSIYEQIKFLQKIGFSFELTINGTVKELATLIAFINFDKKNMFDSAMIVINEVCTDNSFPQEETRRLQATDLVSHLNYYLEITEKYFNILSVESKIDIEKIKSLHDRQNFLDKSSLTDLGFEFV